MPTKKRDNKKIATATKKTTASSAKKDESSEVKKKNLTISERIASNKKVSKDISKNKGLDSKKEPIPREILEDPNISPIFDVFFYRELFMSLRKQFDDVYDKREKSDKYLDEYDEAIYNISVSAIDNAGAQDFLSYCYKKGKYDFCLMNYEKFMKWSLLAAANGNAFTLSKLQIFLNNSIEKLLSSDIHSYLMSFLDLTAENYIMFLSKLVCTEMVNILKISPTTLAKMPETYMEQNEKIQRHFDEIKFKATEIVLKKIAQNNERVKEYIDFNMETEAPSKKQESIKEESLEPTKQIKETVKKEKTTQSKKTPSIKKFRW